MKVRQSLQSLTRPWCTNSEVYNLIGKEMCIVTDVALAKGGTEAIVESFYSSMASQAMHGGQSNEALALR